MKQQNLPKAFIHTEKEPDLFEERIRSTFFPGKFSAPRIDAAFHIFRANAVRALISPSRRNPRTILIEARAGQGKSTLAAQFLHYIQARYAWCQIGPEDKDPIVFMSALFTALLKAFPGLCESRLYKTISNGALIAEEAPEAAAVLTADLKSLLHDEFYLVLDDLHCLDGADASLSFLNRVIAQAPQGLRMMLISRTRIDIRSANMLQLDNQSLAMTQDDVVQLLAALFGISLPLETVAELHRISEGWIMGLILTGNVVLEKLQSDATITISDLLTRQSDQFWTYFQDEILNTLAPAPRRALLELSLLDNIPLALARVLTPALDSAALLDSLAEKNYFLRQLEESPACYCFHQIFQEFLRRRAAKELSQRQRRIVLARAGRWFMGQHHYERALRYYLKAEAHGMVERILRDIGPQLLANNRTTTFKEPMVELGPEMVRPYAWLSFFIANIHVRSEPVQCLPYLEQARRQFIADDNALGELMSTTTLISFHAGIDCRFKDGLSLLNRAETLYENLADQLSVAARIQCGYNLAYGLCYFAGRTRKAARYTDECLKLAEAHGLDDAMASTAVARTLILGLEGRWPDLRHHFEKIQWLLHSPRVGAMAKLAIPLQELAMLGMEGDFNTYQQCRRQLGRLVDMALLTKTIFGSLLLTSDIDTALAQGHLAKALTAGQQGLAAGGSSGSAHMQSHFQAYLAYIHALDGQREACMAAARESTRLREQAGGAFHEVFNRVMLGGAHAYLGMHDWADALLSRAVADADRLGARYILTSAHAHRAYVRLKTGRIQPALEEIAHCLEAMKSAPYQRFFMFNPTLAREILAAAVQHGIEPNLALKIAREQLKSTILPGGDFIPLLEIRSFGGLELGIDAEIRICHKDLTASQRELLALLISAPQTGLSHEVIQDTFWPESPPAKVRSKLDNLLARLRKVFNKHLAPYPAGHYLAMERGFVRLKNCDIDAHRFRNEVRQGLKHIKNGENRQAGHAFYRAHLLHRGAFMPGIHLRDPAAYFQEDLQMDYRQSACQWAQLLADGGLAADAIEVIRKAFQFDPTHQQIVKTYYHLLTQSNETVQARQMLVDYKKALVVDGFSPREIEQILEDFWRSS